MKKIVLIIMLSFVFIGCNRYKKNLDKMSVTVQQEIKDDAFKRNTSVHIYNFNPIKYDTITSLDYDTLNLLTLIDKYHNLESYHESLMKAVDSRIRLANLYSSMGWNDLLENEKKEGLDKIEESKKILAKIKGIMNEDSLLRLKMKNTNNPIKIYRMTAFLKATYKNGKDSTNVMDTLQYFFDENIKLKKLNDYKQFDFE